MAKIIVKCYDTEVTWEVPHDDTTTEEMLKGFMGCLVGLTWYQDNVARAMRSIADDILEDDKV